MLRTRLIVGSILAAMMLGVLFLDDRCAPWFPFLFVVSLLLGVLGCLELHALLPDSGRPNRWLCLGGMTAIIGANWIRPLHEALPSWIPWNDPWHLIVGIVAGTTILAFLVEMAMFNESANPQAVSRIANTAFILIYLGVLASFLIQLRWPASKVNDPNWSTHALLLTVFVPKCGDIGAYTFGRIFGRHKMTPRLSPKKTWEGAAGGLLVAIVIAIIGSALGAQPNFWIAKAVVFGIVVGIAGMLGDLAESLIKREGQKKDASAAVPGFGGVLDVIDSVLFAAPVSFLWLTTGVLSPL